MRENIYKMSKKLLGNPEFCKKLAEKETFDDTYKFCESIQGGYTKEEFESFLDESFYNMDRTFKEMLEQIPEDKQEIFVKDFMKDFCGISEENYNTLVGKLTQEELSKVAGGKSSKSYNKIVASSLAALTFSSPIQSTFAAGNTAVSASSSKVSTAEKKEGEKDEKPGFFKRAWQKTKDMASKTASFVWNNKGKLTIGAAVLAALGLGIAYKWDIGGFGTKVDEKLKPAKDWLLGKVGSKAEVTGSKINPFKRNGEKKYKLTAKLKQYNGSADIEKIFNSYEDAENYSKNLDKRFKEARGKSLDKVIEDELNNPKKLDENGKWEKGEDGKRKNDESLGKVKVKYEKYEFKGDKKSYKNGEQRYESWKEKMIETGGIGGIFLAGSVATAILSDIQGFTENVGKLWNFRWTLKSMKDKIKKRYERALYELNSRELTVEEALENLNELFSVVKGQKKAKQTVRSQVNAILRDRDYAKRKGTEYKKCNVFYFIGPSGVGKSMIACGLADFNVLSSSMPYYMSASSVDKQDKNVSIASQVFGRIAGKDNSGEPTNLVGYIRSNPHGVVVIDEYDKMWCRELDEIFRAAMDKGKIEVFQQEIDCSGITFILTSNESMDALDGKSEKEIDVENGETNLVEHDRSFINRVTRVQFENLSVEDNIEVIKQEFEEAALSYWRDPEIAGIDIILDDECLRKMAKSVIETKRGARYIEVLRKNLMRDVTEAIYGSGDDGSSGTSKYKGKKLFAHFNDSDEGDKKHSFTFTLENSKDDINPAKEKNKDAETNNIDANDAKNSNSEQEKNSEPTEEQKSKNDKNKVNPIDINPSLPGNKDKR